MWILDKWINRQGLQAQGEFLLQQLKIVDGKNAKIIKLIKIFEKVLEYSQINKIARIVCQISQKSKSFKRSQNICRVFLISMKIENETKLKTKKYLFVAKNHFFRGEPQNLLLMWFMENSCRLRYSRLNVFLRTWKFTNKSIQSIYWITCRNSCNDFCSEMRRI